MELTELDYQLIAEIQGGLPLVSNPYAEIAERMGLTEPEVIERVSSMQESGVIKRMGVVVRHHELGYTANAMVVWDVPDEQLDAVGEQLGAMQCTTLCYQRPRCLPEWPYNLFCMIHGQKRSQVLEQVDELTKSPGFTHLRHKILFSGRRFKQRGARYQ